MLIDVFLPCGRLSFKLQSSQYCRTTPKVRDIHRQTQMENMKHLTGLKLAHPAMNDGYFDIMVLIGADYYWSIVQDRVIRGNGPTAVESKIGYLLSGPTTGCNKKLPSTSMMNIMTSHSAEEVDLERFWKVESLGIEVEPDQTHDSYSAEYQSASITFQDGKYFAKLPWKHNNPADILSRGLSYDKFRDNSLWMQGPAWLTNDEKWSIWTTAGRTSTPTYETGERQISSMTIANITTDDKPKGIARVIDLERFNHYKKLLRVTAYVLRFISHCRHQKKTGSLSITEFNDAALEWIRSTQQTRYPDNYRCLQNKTFEKPNLVRQSLYLDEKKLLRCRGRIHNAPLEDDAKFPYLLPPKDRFTALVIEEAHFSHLHSGLESTVTFLQQKFCIPNIRQRVRSAIYRCVICRKVSRQPYSALDPPPLPKDRLRDSPPFTIIGVDFTGALYIKYKDGDKITPSLA